MLLNYFRPIKQLDDWAGFQRINNERSSSFFAYFIKQRWRRNSFALLSFNIRITSFKNKSCKIRMLLGKGLSTYKCISLNYLKEERLVYSRGITVFKACSISLQFKKYIKAFISLFQINWKLFSQDYHVYYCNHA